MLKLIFTSACTLILLTQSALGQSLKLYPKANLQGEAQPFENGYHNQLADSINDRAVSFELAPGHIATFADNPDGTGPSRVYIAAEEKLSINLPPSLQKTVSFIRVSPWKNTHKKSACAAGTAMLDTLNVSWFYNWDSKGQSTESVQFVPMNWGKWKTIEMQELGQRMDVSHHLGFNEPDEPEQANMTVDLAIEKFKLLQASGLRLGSPSPKDNQVGRDWLDEFMAKALKEGLRVDFIAVHYYKKSKPEQFRRWLDYVDKKYNLPIWVTEFNYGATWNWKAKPNKEYVAGLISYLEMLDAAAYVERYSFYNWQPPSGFSIYASKDPAVLNTAGEAFKNHRSQPSPIPRNYVPIPWTDNRIGAFYPVSKASFSADENARTFEIQAAGSGISGDDDQLHYVHQPISSDGQITARVAVGSDAPQDTRAGVMIRESQSADSKYVMVALTNKGQIALHVRSKTGQQANDPIIKSLPGKPNYVRLVRSGNQFIGSASSDGKQWQQVFETTIEMTETVSYGLCVTSNKPGESAVVSFDQVEAKKAE